MIKFNEEYQVYVSDDGKVWNSKMREYKLRYNNGYLRFETHRNHKHSHCLVHRLVYETFVSDIPDDKEIDHINRDRSDNRLCNLRCVDLVGSRVNWIAPKRYPRTEFGEKFCKHYNIAKYENNALYMREYRIYRETGKCSWE